MNRDIGITQEDGQESKREQKEESFEVLNDILSYGGSRYLIHIHVLPQPGALQGKRPKEGMEYIMGQIKLGLHQLAVLLQTDPRWKEVQKITATSPLVAKYPEKLEELGFVIEGEISPELRVRYFADETRKVSEASMSREQFLEIYGGESGKAGAGNIE